MDVDDQDPPVHRISRIEERERLLAEAMAHAEVQEAQYRVLPADELPRGQWKTPLALLIFVVAAGVAAFPPAWAVGPPLPTVQETALERSLEAAVYLQAEQVEVYRRRHARLPASLDDLPIHLSGLHLVKSNSRVYQILARRPAGDALVYDSAHPDPAFAVAASGWTERGAP